MCLVLLLCVHNYFRNFYMYGYCTQQFSVFLSRVCLWIHDEYSTVVY